MSRSAADAGWRWRRVLAAALLLGGCAWAACADPPPAEMARINRLIDAVARADLKFIRNGKEYSAAQAADFLRGKLDWRIEKVSTMQDFIAEVGTRSSTRGDVYLVRLGDGRTLPCAEYLAQELRRIEKR